MNKYKAPASFARILKGMTLEQLRELVEFNEQDSGFNRHVLPAIRAELWLRERLAVALKGEHLG